MKEILFPIAIGFVFGFALQKAGLGHYDKIVNQFRFKDNTMMKFMFSAMAVGTVSFFILKDLGLIRVSTVPETYLVGNLAGGLIFGVGMAISGTCTNIFDGVGQGNLDYLFPAILGILTGALVFGIVFEDVYLPIYSLARYGAVTFEEILGVNHWVFVAIVCAAVITFFAVSRILERRDMAAK